MSAPLSYPFKGLGIITVTTSGTPVQFQSTTQRVPTMYVLPIKSKGTANSGNYVYIEDAAQNVLFAIPKGALLPIEISAKKAGFADNVNLADLYLDADSSGDGLLVTVLTP